MLFHSLRTKVLRSLHNDTQQPVIYLVEGKNVVVPVGAHSGEDREAGLSHITRATPEKQHTCLQRSVAILVVEIVSTLLRVLTRPVKTSAGRAVRRLALMGRE